MISCFLPQLMSNVLVDYANSNRQLSPNIRMCTKKTSDTSDSQTVTRLMAMEKVLFSSFHVNDTRFLFVHMFFHDKNKSHFVLIYSAIFSPKLVKHQGGERETSKEQRKGEEETPAVPQVLLHRVSVVIQCPHEACGRLLM